MCLGFGAANTPNKPTQLNGKTFPLTKAKMKATIGRSFSMQTGCFRYGMQNASADSWKCPPHRARNGESEHPFDGYCFQKSIHRVLVAKVRHPTWFRWGINSTRTEKAKNCWPLSHKMAPAVYWIHDFCSIVPGHRLRQYGACSDPPANTINWYRHNMCAYGISQQIRNWQWMVGEVPFGTTVFHL